MDIAQGIEQISIALIPMLLGVVCHEVAHGYVAYKLGDLTAKEQGRLTLNPFHHIDAMGACVFLFTTLFTPFSFGWAKPIPVNPRYFSNIRKGLLLVALAGPLTNIILALVFSLLLKLMTLYNGLVVSEVITIFLYRMLTAGVFINVMLAVFNLLPLPPLDGSKIVSYVLPAHIAYRYEKLERWGIAILFLLMMFDITRILLVPCIQVITRCIFLSLSLG